MLESAEPQRKTIKTVSFGADDGAADEAGSGVAAGFAPCAAGALAAAPDPGAAGFAADPPGAGAACVRHGLGGDLYSTGMDRLAEEINRATPVGWHAVVSGGNDPRLDENSFDNRLLAALGKGATVIFIGHSLGADQALRFARKAKVAGFRLPLICPVDPVKLGFERDAMDGGALGGGRQRGSRSRLSLNLVPGA